MSRTKTPLLKTFRKPALQLGSVVLFAALLVSLNAALNQTPAVAQSSSLVLSNIKTSSVTSNSATITWNSNAPADSLVNYGLTGSYGLSESNGTLVTNHAIIIGGLQAGSVYHFQVVSVDASGNRAESLDRTFTTSSGSSNDTTPPNIFNVRVDSGNTSAIVSFTTDEDAGVTVDYGTTTAYGSTVDRSGNFLTNHTIDLSPLNPLTTYHYQITAADRNGNTRVAGDFQFTTSGSPFDRIFTTGACPDGTDIGQCNAAGQYCDNGTLIFNCTQCGFVCAQGQTCRQGGVCIQDPPQSGSAYECNPGTCYTSCNGSNNRVSCLSNADCVGIGNGQCLDDGRINNPAPAGCYASWDRCNANIVLKVRRDRVCDRWLTCQTGTTIINKDTGRQEHLCYDLTGCNELGPDGTCTGVLSERQCSNDPLTLCNTSADCPAGGSCVTAARFCSNAPNTLCIDDADCTPPGTCTGGIREVTYQTPAEIGRIKNLSGAVVAGLDWTDVNGTRIIQGYYPWSVMPQLGGKIEIENPSFEERENALTCDNNPSKRCTLATQASDCGTGQCVNAVYKVAPWGRWSPSKKTNEDAVVIKNVWDGDVNSGNRVLQIDPTSEPFSGAAASVAGNSAEAYFITLRIKASTADTRAVVQFGENVPPLPEAVVNLTTGWQQVTVGPARGIGQNSIIKVVCFNDGQDCPEYQIFIDDVQIRPILEVRSTDSDSTGEIVRRIPPSCRLFPRSNSQACQYTDENGVKFRGWFGYCLEEWPAGSGNCISWWPVDLIKGELNIFGDEQIAGYQGRTPLYYCFESRGRADYNLNGEDYGYFRNDFLCFPQPSGDFEFAICTDTDACASSTACDNIVSGKPSLDSLHDYEIGALRVYSPQPNGAWALRDGNKDFVVGQWRPKDRPGKCGSECDWWYEEVGAQNKTWNIFFNDDSHNFFRLHFVFDKNTGQFKSWSFGGNDDTGTDIERGVWNFEFITKEMCTKLVQVAKFGENKAWAQRVGSSFPVPDLNYRQPEDLAPFGGAVNEDNVADPSAWSGPVFAEKPAVGTDFPNQVRSGSPYACVGNCNQRRCLGGLGISQFCLSSEDCTNPQTNATGVCIGVGVCSNGNVTSDHICTSDSECQQGGTCIGGAASNRGTQGFTSLTELVFLNPSNSEFAMRNIARLFAQSYGIWGWSFAERKYVDLNPDRLGQWLPPNNACPQDPDGGYNRPAVGTSGEYCAIPPVVTNLVIGKNNAKTVKLAPGGGTVEFRFTVNADAQQVPLREVTFDWGDGSRDTFSLYPLAPKSSLSDPHIITKAFNCVTPGGCDDLHPRIQVKDNWGWCNGAFGSSNCPSDRGLWFPQNNEVEIQFGP